MGTETLATPWGTEETLCERMERLLRDAHAAAENDLLDEAAMHASAALEAWRGEDQ